MDHTVVITILTMLPARPLVETCASGQGSMLLLELFLQVQDGDGDFLTSLWLTFQCRQVSQLPNAACVALNAQLQTSLPSKVCLAC